MITKTEAAEIVATSIRVYAREHGLEVVTKALVEERISELAGYFEDGLRKTYLTESATIANVKTTLRKATAFPL